MPSRRDLDLSRVTWQSRYTSSREDLVTTFYRPALDRSTTYDRAAGYFRSTLFSLVGESMSAFALRGGRMRLICSPELTAVDAETLQKSQPAALTAALTREMEQVLEHPMGRDPLEVLAALVATGALEVRLALADRGRGIFHSKVGVFEDGRGKRVSFSGSINESWSGWHPLGNHENFEVFRSWGGDAARVTDHRSYFEALWRGEEPEVSVVGIPEAFESNLVKIVSGGPSDSLKLRVARASASAPRRLLDHQAKALSNWRQAGQRGIFVHATGSGKTITGLHATRECLPEGLSALILVPSALLLEQWAEEARQELGDLDPSILLAGAGNDKWRDGHLLEGHLAGGDGRRVVIATIATASSERFLDVMERGRYLLVSDEVHRLGAPGAQAILERAIDGPRLGLSATPVRAYDSEGTNALLTFFGGVIPPVVSLQDAIDAGRLCEYEYWPTVVSLAAEEQEAWERLTRDIRQRYAREASGSSDFEPSSELKFLLIKRAGLAKRASQKVPAATRILGERFEVGQRWIVYCEDQDQVREMLASARSEGLPAHEYHSAMRGSRDATLRAFRQEGGILVSIRCLDEGVDIPEVSHALIMASSRNYREFVQRRGRVLRRSEQKHFATVFDLLVIPANNQSDDFDSLISGEILRAAEFAGSAVNRAARARLEALAAENGLDLEAVAASANHHRSLDVDDEADGD